jgi:hypothetical protein
VAVVVPFEDIVQAHRRRQAHLYGQRCIELIELNLRLALEQFERAPADERPVFARRIRQLGALLEYAVEVV